MSPGAVQNALSTLRRHPGLRPDAEEQLAPSKEALVSSRGSYGYPNCNQSFRYYAEIGSLDAHQRSHGVSN